MLNPRQTTTSKATTIHKAEPYGDFTRIDNSIIRDSTLSSEARLLLIYCLSLPATWQLQIREVAKALGWGRDKTSRIFRRLERRGYAKLVTHPRSASGQHQGCIWHVFQNPADSSKTYGKRLKHQRPSQPLNIYNFTHNINYPLPENRETV